MNSYISSEAVQQPFLIVADSTVWRIWKASFFPSFITPPYQKWPTPIYLLEFQNFQVISSEFPLNLNQHIHVKLGPYSIYCIAFFITTATLWLYICGPPLLRMQALFGVGAASVLSAAAFSVVYSFWYLGCIQPTKESSSSISGLNSTDRSIWKPHSNLKTQEG